VKLLVYKNIILCDEERCAQPGNLVSAWSQNR